MIRPLFRAIDTRLLVVALGIAATACDPCAGTGACGGEPRVVLNVQMVDAVTGAGAGGVRVLAVRSGGIELASDSMFAISDARGHWRIEQVAASEGEVELAVTVSPADAAPYTVSGLRVPTVHRSGDAGLVQRWVTRPWFPVSGLPVALEAPQQRFPEIQVEFRQTGGPPLIGPGIVAGRYRTTTDSYGFFQFFRFQAFGTALEPVTGDLIFRLPMPYGERVATGVSVSPTHIFRAPTGVLPVELGEPVPPPLDTTLVQR
jgi:hypothetical protein